MRHFLLSVLLLSLWLITPSPLAADHPVPAVYTIGNIDGISSGDAAELNLQESSVLIHSGKMDIEIPYSRIRNTELGERLKPVHRGLKLHKEPVQRVLTIEFNDAAQGGAKSAANADASPKTIGLQVEEQEGADLLLTIDERSGRHRKTNADTWWGDSAWKTNQNGQSVKPDSLGKLGN